jgi:CspA family cold shock protein
METGTVKFFNEDKGFGFIKNNADGRESFVHISMLGGLTIKEGDVVNYDIEQSDKGQDKTNAVNVRMA